jgi:hypothetical protein
VTLKARTEGETGWMPRPVSTASGGSTTKICQVCHQQNAYFRRTLGTSTHYAGSECMQCHKHNQGFAASACEACHGNPPYNPGGGKAIAPNVMTYWSGSVAGRQDGGHGDPDGRAAAIQCGGCHDISQPPGTHLDGTLNSVGETAAKGNRNANTAHLSPFYFGTATGASKVQVDFDNGCYTQCHLGISSNAKFDMRHSKNPPVAPFGPPHCIADGLTIPWPVDYDLSTTAPAAAPHYAPCVACHNPHGTGTTDKYYAWDYSGTDGIPYTNFMLRGNWKTQSSVPGVFCKVCH